MEQICQIMFYNQLPPCDTITSGPWLQKWAWFQNGVEPGHLGGHQVSGHGTDLSNHVYNQLPTSDTIHKWTLPPEVGRFNIDALTDVETKRDE